VLHALRRAFGFGSIAELIAMKQWRWRKILIGVAVFLVVLGIAPLAYFFGFGRTHNFTPLSVPISLKSGEYVSPFFTTDLDDDYQVEIYFLPLLSGLIWI